jgi:hypothetical protein
VISLTSEDTANVAILSARLSTARRPSALTLTATDWPYLWIDVKVRQSGRIVSVAVIGNVS